MHSAHGLLTFYVLRSEMRHRTGSRAVKNCMASLSSFPQKTTVFCCLLRLGSVVEEDA